MMARVVRRPASCVVLVAALAVSVSCGSDEGAGQDATAATTTAESVSHDEAGTTAPTTTGDDDTADVATTTDPPPSGPARPALGLPELTLLTEPSDDQRPLLRWEPVDGAAQYSVSVFAPSGVGYWAWRTDGTSVHLGGEPRLRDDVSGPSTVPGMTWSVLALDADGRPIAASVESVLRP